MATLPEILEWASKARRTVGLSGEYRFELVPNLQDETGRPITGCVMPEGQILLNAEWRTPEWFMATYLHEVGHVVAENALIDDDPTGRIHNKYFAALVATMYRRAGLLDRLKLYDFADGLAYQNGERHPVVDEGMADGDELIQRFQYIVLRSAQLARSRLTIEAAAESIFQKDCLPEWSRKPEQASAPAPWWRFWR